MSATNLSAADRRLTLGALAVVVLLAALDQTIVATAMPRIIEELRGLSMYAWVTTSYMLTSTVSVPIYGKLSDQFGRKPMLIFGVLTFLVGSVLCGLSGELGELPLLGGGMSQLVIFRGLQGLGGGGLMTIAFAIMADMYPPRERGRVFGVFGGVFGLATVVGPFIGGFFTDHAQTSLFGYHVAGWRWVFYVNLPLGALALFMILYRLPATGGRTHADPAAAAAARTIDYAGAALVVLSVTPLLLALTLGGTTLPWNSAPILAMFGVALVSFVLLLYVEARAVEPILPLHLFRIPAFRIATLASFVMSMAFLGVVMFMPLYMQVVQGVSATESGVALLPLMLAMIISSIATGRLVSRVGRYKAFMIGGGATLVLGVLALTTIGPDTTGMDLTWRLALTGLGLGPAQTLFSLVIQNSAPAEHLGVATSMSQFSRQMGSTVGVAIFGAFLTQALITELPRHTPMMPGANAPTMDLAHAQSQAMHVDTVKQGVAIAMDERLEVLKRAYAGEQRAIEEIASDSHLPDEVRATVQDGGVRGRIHRELTRHADKIERELSAGREGRDRLANDPELPAALRAQISDIPSRAFTDAQSLGHLIALFRQAVLKQEDALTRAAIDEQLLLSRTALTSYGERLVQQIQRGVRVAFSTAIVHMLERALIIVAAALLIVFFIPELPLRTKTSTSQEEATPQEG